MTMREASLDTTFFGGLGGSVLNIKSTPLAACVCDEENLLAAARRVEAQRHIILRSESRRRNIMYGISSLELLAPQASRHIGDRSPRVEIVGATERGIRARVASA